MAGSEPTYYWDSCLFVAWLKDEERKSGEMDGVREVIDRAKRREVKIVTSVLTYVEVLSGKIPAGMDTLFAGMMKRVNRVGVDTKVASVAHDCATTIRRAQRNSTARRFRLPTPFIWQAGSSIA